MKDHSIRYALFLGAAAVALAGPAHPGPAHTAVTLITPSPMPMDPLFVCDTDDREEPYQEPEPEPEPEPDEDLDDSPSLGEEEPTPPASEFDASFGPISFLGETPPELLLADCHTGPQVSGRRATPEVTRAVRTTLEEGRDFCELIPEIWQISCLADRFREVARSLPRGGDYGPVREALMEGAVDLERVAKTYAEPNTEKQRYGSRPTADRPAITTRPLTPVNESALPQARAAAVAVIEETQTVLLRSTQNSQNRQLSYAEISTALDSTKLLLRST